MNAPTRRLVSPGPVAEAFGRSRAFICGIIGPVGSGKTMAALQKGLWVGARQKGVVDARGVTWRKARIGVIRESYPSLKSTTLKSWFNIVLEGEGKFNWTPPYTHKFRKILRRDADRRPIDILDIEFEFRAIGDQTVEEACRGWEVNAVIVDEADLQPEDLVPFLTGRVGRFSDLDPSAVVDPQIILSLNMPDIENHVYELLVDRDLESLGLSEDDRAILETVLDGRPLIDCFIQPGGREPDAENLHNLPGGRGYYVLQVASNRHKPGYIDRMVDNKPVPLQHGQPVNAEFSYTVHVRPVIYMPRRKLIVGIDQGLYAAAVACQRDADTFRSLAELVNTDKKRKTLLKVGPTAFGSRLKNLIATRFPDVGPDDIRAVADPAAFAASDREDNEHDWLLACQKALGLKIHRAKSNRAALRNEAIWRVQSARGGYEIDPSCSHLIKAHSGGYRYQKAELGTGETRGHLEIANTIYTHIADAEQYAALEGDHVISDIRGRSRTPCVVVNVSDYNEQRGY